MPILVQKGIYLGEVNADKKAHGRGIHIFFNGSISIKYYNNGEWAPGNYFHKYINGDFVVGVREKKDDGWITRGTVYLIYGSTNKFED